MSERILIVSDTHKRLRNFDIALDQLFAQFGDSVGKLQKLLEMESCKIK